jgi:NAD(P)-dependent dehydrogenase (short-subunit alcohol dehydrogenase family)
MYVPAWSPPPCTAVAAAALWWLDSRVTEICCLHLHPQNALKLMSKAKKGRIVNITSVVGVVGNAGQVSRRA